jgi:hypothetical protein
MYSVRIFVAVAHVLSYRHRVSFLCSEFALQLKYVLLLDAPQLLMLSAETSIYLKDKMFVLIIFCYKQFTSVFVIFQFTHLFFPFQTT